MDLSLFFAGTAGSVPSARRGLPALLVRRGGDRILFDCGEGTQRQLVSSVGLADLDAIFLTHFHADHWLGLPGMLKTFDLRGRERPLTVHGPRGLRALHGAGAAHARPRRALSCTLVELEPGDVLERDGYRIAPCPSPIAARRSAMCSSRTSGRACSTRTPARARVSAGPRVRARAARRDGQRRDPRAGDGPAAARAQARALRRHAAVRGAAGGRPPRRRARPRGDVRRGGARARGRDTGTPPPRQAAEIARDAEVTMLALNHFSTRYPLGLLRDEARAVFAPTVLPRDFDTIEIPFAERGEPQLVRWDPGQRSPPATADGRRPTPDMRALIAGAAARPPRLIAERLAPRARARPRRASLLDPRVYPTLWPPGRTRRRRPRSRDGLRASSSTGSATASGCGCCATARPGVGRPRRPAVHRCVAGRLSVEVAWAIVPERGVRAWPPSWPALP